MKTTIYSLSFIFLSCLNTQEPELYIPKNIQKATTNQTRSAAGHPGVQYWQNRADYKINVEINPASGLITGNEKIVYFNNSPDSFKS